MEDVKKDFAVEIEFEEISGEQIFSPTDAFEPILVKGMVVYPKEPLKFRFIVDSGKDKVSNERIKDESERIVKYFLAAVTVPERDQWVNLSPLEHDRMISDVLGQTDLGRDMLAQDYILKQFTSSLLNPDSEVGKEFWAKVYAKAQSEIGVADLPMDAFNKVWIMPDKAEVYEQGNAVYVTGAHLKVMLDADYQAMQNANIDGAQGNAPTAQSIAKDIMREVIVPVIEHEINTGANFATVRQIYYAGILARWYRDTIKNSLMASAYMDEGKTKGVDVDDKTLKEQIYQRYIDAYKKGVVNFIREEVDPLTGESIPRKYFSGGMDKAMPDYTEKTGNREKLVARGPIQVLDFATAVANDTDLLENVSTVSAPIIKEVEMSPNEIQRIKSEADGEFAIKILTDDETRESWPYHRNNQDKWLVEPTQSKRALTEVVPYTAFSYLKNPLISKNGTLAIVPLYNDGQGEWSGDKQIELNIFENNLHISWQTSSEEHIELNNFPIGFSTILAPNGDFFLMTFDGYALTHWFKDHTGAWTSIDIANSNDKNYKNPALAPDETYLLTTTDDKKINIWKRDANKQWQLDHDVDSPEAVDAFYIAPNSQYFVTVNRTSATAYLWYKNSGGQWTHTEFNGVPSVLRVRKDLEGNLLITPQVVFDKDSKYIVMDGATQKVLRVDMGQADAQEYKVMNVINQNILRDNGGIDIQNINVLRKGASKIVHFDQAALADIVAKGFDGQ